MLQFSRISQTKEDPDRGSSLKFHLNVVWFPFGWKFGWTQSCPKLWVFLTPALPKKWRIWRFLTARQTKNGCSNMFTDFHFPSSSHQPHCLGPSCMAESLGYSILRQCGVQKRPPWPGKNKNIKNTINGFDGVRGIQWVQFKCEITLGSTSLPENKKVQGWV